MTADHWRDDPTIKIERPARQQTSISIYNLPGYFIPAASDMVKSTLASFPQQPLAQSGDSLPSKGMLEFTAIKAHHIAIRYGEFIYSGIVDPELGEIN